MASRADAEQTDVCRDLTLPYWLSGAFALICLWSLAVYFHNLRQERNPTVQ